MGSSAQYRGFSAQLPGAQTSESRAWAAPAGSLRLALFSDLIAYPLVLAPTVSLSPELPLLLLLPLP